VKKSQDFNQISCDAHSSHVAASTRHSISKARLEQERKNIPCSLNNQRITAITLGIEADDIVASFESSDRVRVIKPEKSQPCAYVLFLEGKRTSPNRP
jgi:hypothetical protein